MEQRTDDGLSPYRTYTRAEWAALRDDMPMTLDAGRGQPAALAARPARHEGGRGHLSAAVAAAVALCGGDAAAASRAAALPRHRGRQGALHHRRRGLGRGRQVDHRARAAGAAGALAQRAEGRSHHHRRLPAAERGAGARRPDGEEGLSGKLRPAGAAAVSVRREGRPPAGARADLFASGLRRDAEPVGRGRPARHPDRRRPERAADRPPAEGRQGDSVRVGLLRLLGLSRRRRGRAEALVRRSLPDACAAPRSAIRNPTSIAIRS